MPVVADTMLLRYLIDIEVVQILPHLFTQVIITPAVARELDHPHAPGVVRTWMAAPPEWLRLRQPALPQDPGLRRLHAGEQEALLLLTDDGDAYKIALARQIPVVRTLRLLATAATQDLIDLPTVLRRLDATTFYMPRGVMALMLAQDAARKATAPPLPTASEETAPQRWRPCPSATRGLESLHP